MSKSLVEEKVKLEEIQEAINIESSNLKDLYEIKVNAQTLEALLISQKKQKELFEQEMGSCKAELEAEISDQKSNWKKAQEAYAVQQQDKLKLLQTEQVREAEEYQYKLKIRDQRDKDEYEQKKLKLERELEAKQKQVEEDLNQRIATVKLQEEELKSFREAKESPAKELQEAIETTRAKTFEQLETKYKYDSQLKAKDTEATISLLNQTISFLKEKLTEKEKAIATIQAQVATAQLQSQDLAKKVVEGVSNQKLEVKEARSDYGKKEV